MWREIGKKYKPRVVCIEYNFQYSPYSDVVVEYREEGNPVYKEGGNWTLYQGASMLGMHRLARYLGYSLVETDKNGINLFFVRDECIPEGAFPLVNNLTKIYNKAFFSRLANDIIGYPVYKNDVNVTTARELLGLDHGSDISEKNCEYIQWHIPLWKIYDRHIIPFNPNPEQRVLEDILKY